MTSKTEDSSSQVLPQGDNATTSGPLAGPPEHQSSRARANQVFKSGPLFISSKGIGWTSWKKRWFILTRTSLVFFRSDPSATPQKGGEVNLTLGGIDLNNSASVEVKVDKKLLTVFFPDGRDGRAFTLKAETIEDLQEWKTALENAIQLAPTATHGAGQNGLLKNDQADASSSADQQKDKPPIKSMVIGRPILLALEDIDGSPSFLEKALRFIEDHGFKVEGVLRQAADVDDVHRRVREYEQGKNEFSPEEDAHVIGDCVKYILRELPSPPVPASCCNALLDAFRTDRNNRLNAMRTAILETFPEPNRRLLQRILLMMQTVASNKNVNRMSTSAVAACMSPLLLRPLLAGDCELENTHMDVAGDGSLQLLQAAAAANHAQAIIITLLDEYDNIFGEGSMSAALFSSDESGTGTEEATDDGTYDEDDDDYLDEDSDDDDDASDDHEYASDGHDEETEDDYEHSVTETCSESGDHAESDSYDEKASRSSSFTESPKLANNNIAKHRSPSSSPLSLVPRNDNRQGVNENLKRNNDRSIAQADVIGKSRKHTNVDTSSENESASSTPRFGGQMSSTKVLGTSQVKRQRWGRTSAKRNLSMESIDFALEDEDDEIQQLEAAKINLQNRIVEEANGNAILQASLERRKKALHDRRLALEKDVARLQKQLQKEKDLRAALEVGSKISHVPSSGSISEKANIDLQEIAIAEENFNNLKQRFDDLGAELSNQHEHNATLLHDRKMEIEDASNQRTMLSNKDHETKGTSDHAERSSKDDNHPNDTSRGGSSKFGRLQNNPTSSEAPVIKSSASTSRKSSSKGEGGNTTSALTKLTNRLNFLKERRNQIAFDLQNIDKGKGFSNPPALSPGKGKAPELPIIHSLDKNHGSGGCQDDRADQTTQTSSNWMSTEGDNKEYKNKNDNKRSSNTRSDATSSDSSGKGMSNEGEKTEGDRNKSSALRTDAPSSYNSAKGMPNEGEKTEGYNKDSNKKSDGKRSSNSRSDALSSYSSGKGMLNDGDNKDNNKKNNNKRSSNSKLDAPSHISEKGMPNEGEEIKADNKDSDKKSDNKRSSSSKSDARSYSSGKGILYEGEETKGDNKDSNKRSDSKRSSSSKSDTPSSYSSGKGVLNVGEEKEGDNKDSNQKNDNNKRSSNSKLDVPLSYSATKAMSNEGDNKDSDQKADNKDNNKKGSSSKSDASSSQSSGDSNDRNRKTENKSGNRRGFFSSKSSSQNSDQGRKSENQSSQNLDKVKPESRSSRNSDKGHQQDGQSRG